MILEYILSSGNMWRILCMEWLEMWDFGARFMVSLVLFEIRRKKVKIIPTPLGGHVTRSMCGTLLIAFYNGLYVLWDINDKMEIHIWKRLSVSDRRQRAST